MTSVNDLIKTEWKCFVPNIISTEKYAELCRKAEAIDAIRAEIEKERNDYDCIGGDFGDNTAYGLQLALDIIDKHIGKEEEDGRIQSS